MKLNLKYNARIVDEIEQTKKLPIENCIADTTVGNLTLFIQKGLIDDNGVHGVSKNTAIDVLENYLADNDKDELLMDIMEALMNGGFLSRDVNLSQIRALKAKRQKELQVELEKSL